VKVPDNRLYELAEMAGSEKIVPEMIEYVDIAGLVKGASKGEGLGNKFLTNIRMTDAIVHVVRCFDDENVIHVDGNVNPRRDIETINLELVFADLDQVERRMKKVAKDALQKAKGAAEEKEALDKIIAMLMEGKPARNVELTDKQKPIVKQLNLITMKPMIYAGNVSEEELATGNAFFDVVKEVAAETGDQAVMVSAQVEGELAGLDAEEKKEYLAELGVEESGCESLTRASYKLLGLRTYFTVGPKEAHAWTIREGWKAPRAAGVIHTDFEDGFIKVEAIGFQDLLEAGSEDGARSKGKMRIEGKDYVVQEGDVMHFRFRD
jgi:GTP-binding protein YchF